MMIRQPRTRKSHRGVILLVVLAMLTLFTIIGLVFVFLADSYATSARVALDAEKVLRPAVEPELALACVLGQLICDVPDEGSGIHSSLRGHSLARNLYGWNDAAGFLNDKAFAGLGRLRYPSTVFPSVNDSDLLNCKFFESDGWVRDPERLGSHPPGQSRGSYVPGNVPYTYVDNNNAYLAFLNPVTSRIEIPSFHRPWVFNLDPQTGKLLANPPPFNDPRHPNWSSPAGKYLTLRPRPAEMGPGFPYPADPGGDVKNCDGAPGGNDSIWIDIDAPVLLAPNGQKYKMLAALLVVELDSRINVNVHGNVLGTKNAHAGNQGFGPWEVNLGKVLTGTQPGTASPEWINLFLGTPANQRVLGRYGPRGLPLRPGGFTPPANGVSRGWAQTDQNGVTDPSSTSGAPTPPYRLPTGFGPGFPDFPGSGYQNGYPREYTSTGTATGTLVHPMLCDPVHPAAGNRAFSVPDMVPLLRHGGTNWEFLSSDLLRLCPSSLQSATARNQITTTSFDLDRPVAVPYVWDKSASPYKMSGAYPYSLKQADVTAPFDQSQFAALNQALSGPLPALTEFDANWRSVLTQVGKLDLNRPLAPYPNPDPTTGLIASDDLGQYDKALQDRQDLARDIFLVLQQVTGARHPTSGLGAAEFNALRALAQIAVNIVDFIDSDDNRTPFNWFGSEWVFGVELPRLVINETYVQYDNDPADPGFDETVEPPSLKRATTHYNVNVWVELLNPLNGTTDRVYQNPPRTGFPNKDVEARLASNAGPIYQVVIANPLSSSAALLDPANVTGDPDFQNGSGPSRVHTIASDFGANPIVLPTNGTYSSPGTGQKGFFVLGPQVAFLVGENPDLPCSHKSPSMTYPVPVTAFGARRPARPIILLRRLACPGLPVQSNPKLPHYNPFLTVDYCDNTAPPGGNDARQYKTSGPNQELPMAARKAMGRMQPYAAASSQVVAQQPLPALGDQPQHTFFRHNGQGSTAPAASDATLKVPFDWLVHLDRPLISKTELLYVAGCKPHELTHLFTSGTNANQQIAPWLDQTTRLYRFLEFAGVTPLTGGVPLGGRVPGRINVNMVFAPETWRAICDAQPGNRYTQTQVDDAFAALLQQRTPTVQSGTHVPGPNDTPFWGLGAGPASGNDLLTANPRGLNNQLFTPPGYDSSTNPYQRFEMLNKVFSNVTTRSNVFAVWITVGFFEVTDDTTIPPKLGPEIGKDQGRLIRHRMFAIVDRTNLRIFATTSKAAITASPGGTTAAVQLADMNGTVGHSGFAWNVQPGSVLTYEPDDPLGNEETVVVQANNQATFFKNHPAGCRVISRGNPGPWTQQRYDPRRDSAVVPYFAVIE